MSTPLSPFLLNKVAERLPTYSQLNPKLGSESRGLRRVPYRCTLSEPFTMKTSVLPMYPPTPTLKEDTRVPLGDLLGLLGGESVPVSIIKSLW